MIYNVERLDRVIDKIIRDLGLGDDNIPYADFVEWIADGLQHIGSYYQFLEKEAIVVVKDYTGLLPCDFHKMIYLHEGCSFTNFDYSFEKTMENFYLQKLENLGSVVNMLNFNKNLIGDVSINQFTQCDYNINFNRITTSFKDGLLRVQYLAMPIDERGWPLVPDDVSFRDALFWKVAYHLSMRNPKCLSNPRMQDMEYCRQKWNYYCVQARAAANMPDLAMTERLANNWLRLFNTVDDSSDYYRTVGKRQILNFDK